MLRYNLRLAFRHLAKDARTSLLNLAGLVIGLASFAVITVFALHELSYDRFHAQADRIYRATTFFTRGDQEVRWAITNGHLDPLLETQVPEVETATKLLTVQSNYVFQVGDRAHTVPEGTGFFAESDLFRIFDGFRFRTGDPATALDAPDQIVLTASLARRYFDRLDVVGETVVWKLGEEGDKTLTVSGVVDDVPPNSHLQFDFLLSGPTTPFWERVEDPQQGGFPVHVYFLAHADASESRMRRNIAQATETAYAHLAAFTFPVQPLTEIHFHADNLFEHTDAGNEDFIRILLLVGVLMVVVAGINYVMLNTSKSLQRAREIGVRKTLGAAKASLVGLVLTEGALLGLGAAVLSVVAAEIVLRTVVAARFGVALSVLDGGLLVAAFLVLGVAVGVFSGLFLAFKVASLNPVETLRGRLETRGGRGFGVRDGLVTLQFVITAMLLIGSLVVFRQIDYLRGKDLGYTKEFVINIPRSSGVEASDLVVYRDAILQETFVEGAGTTLYEFISDYNATSLSVLDAATSDTFSARVQWNAVDPGLVPALEMELVEGRNFDEAHGGDGNAFLINEAAKRALGAEDVVGKRIPPSFFAREGGEIIGVVKDFHFQSFDQEVAPVLLVPMQDFWVNNLLVRVRTDDVRGALATLQARWTEQGIEAPFEYTFLDDWFEALIRRERQFSTLVILFTLLSVIVAGLGLVGLISFTAERRKKEIGIRKVFGASVRDVLLLINRRFLGLLALAFVVAVPVAWWGMRRWLQQFAYRIEPAPVDVALACAVLLLLAVATISLRALGAARTNPVNVLKQE